MNQEQRRRRRAAFIPVYTRVPKQDAEKHFLFARKIGSLYAQSFFRLSNHSISRDGHESAFDILGMSHSIKLSLLYEVRREG